MRRLYSRSSASSTARAGDACVPSSTDAGRAADSPSDSKIGLPDPVVAAQIGGARGDDDAPVLDDVALIGVGQGGRGVLLRHEEREAAALQLLQSLEDLLDDDRRQ